jgi:hypothetical protein
VASGGDAQKAIPLFRRHPGRIDRLRKGIAFLLTFMANSSCRRRTGVWPLEIRGNVRTSMKGAQIARDTS